jgi:hypothetical protein
MLRMLECLLQGGHMHRCKLQSRGHARHCIADTCWELSLPTVQPSHACRAAAQALTPLTAMT